MANSVYQDKYRDEFIGNYWSYLIRQVERGGHAPGGVTAHAGAD
jgi:hypothetical protein